MAGTLRESDLRDAAERVSSSPTSYRRQAGGSQSKDVEWDVLKGRVARAIVSVPDLVLYFAYLASNRACARAVALAAQLSDMAVLVEGWKYAAPVVTEPARLQKALGTFGNRTVVTQADVARLTAEANTYIENTLLPAVSRGARVQQRGEDAVAAYKVLRTECITGWGKFRQELRAACSGRRPSTSALRAAALQVPLASLSKTADALDPARLLDYTVQLAAASSAISAMGRDLDLRVRFRAGTDPFPAGSTVSAAYTAGYVTELTPSTSPLLLGIKTGDEVQSDAGGTAEVIAVGETSVTLRNSSIVTILPAVTIYSTPYLRWRELSAEVGPLYRVLPTEKALAGDLQRQEEVSAAKIKKLMEYLCKYATILDVPSAAAVTALERVGGTPYTMSGPSIATALRGFSPLFGVKTKQAGDQLVVALEEAGFDYAVELLYKGDMDELLTRPASQMSRVGRLGDAMAVLGSYTGGMRGLG